MLFPTCVSQLPSQAIGGPSVALSNGFIHDADTSRKGGLRGTRHHEALLIRSLVSASRGPGPRPLCTVAQADTAHLHRSWGDTGWQSCLDNWGLNQRGGVGEGTDARIPNFQTQHNATCCLLHVHLLGVVFLPHTAHGAGPLPALDPAGLGPPALCSGPRSCSVSIVAGMKSGTE